MDFKDATDGLFDRIDHRDLAKALGVSVASIRQARLRQDANAHRAAPRDWKKVLIRLAERQSAHFQRLASVLKRDET